MQIIPVLDIKNKHVVHAIKGDRAAYHPINSPLCQSSDPFDVINGFLQVADFKCLYIADLDAIMKQNNNDALLISLARHYSEINFWIDNGLRKVYQLIALPNVITIVASESLPKAYLPNLSKLTHPWILSLDFDAAGRLGPEAIFEDAYYWPALVIVMTLAQVGSQAGPDLEKLQDLSEKYPDKQFIAAGGIRNLEDLLRLKVKGIDYALLASALHNGRIDKRDISRLAG